MPRNAVIAANSDAVQRCAKLRVPINIVYDGLRLSCPIRLDGVNSSPTIPKLATVLAFVFSELMTNAAKHIWNYISDEITQVGLYFALKAYEQYDGYYFDVCFAPSKRAQPSPVLVGEAQATTGLNSIKLALRSIGTKALESKVVWQEPSTDRVIELGKLPFPIHVDTSIKGHQATWTVSRFGPLSRELFRVETSS